MGEAQSGTKSVVVAPDTEAVHRMLAMLEHFQPRLVICAPVVSLVEGDQFFEWPALEVQLIASTEPIEKPATCAAVQTSTQPSKDAPSPTPKLRSKFMMETTTLATSPLTQAIRLLLTHAHLLAA